MHMGLFPIFTAELFVWLVGWLDGCFVCLQFLLKPAEPSAPNNCMKVTYLTLAQFLIKVRKLNKCPFLTSAGVKITSGADILFFCAARLSIASASSILP